MSAAQHARLLVEVTQPHEARPLPRAAQADVRWLPRGDDPRRAGTCLLAALRDMPALPPGPGRIYVGCEAMAMRSIRRLLDDELHIDKSRLVTRGYWQLGEANHPDQDYGDDAP